VVRTSGEHPFYVDGKGWTACNRLEAGDLIRTGGGWVPVGEVWDTGAWEVVYNVRVSDHHTYFVGEEGWGWSAWAHNAYDVEIVAAQLGAYSTDMQQVIAIAATARINREYAIASGALLVNGHSPSTFGGNFMVVKAITPTGIQLHTAFGTRGAGNHSEPQTLEWLRSVGATKILASFSEHVSCRNCSLRYVPQMRQAVGSFEFGWGINVSIDGIPSNNNLKLWWEQTGLM